MTIPTPPSFPAGQPPMGTPVAPEHGPYSFFDAIKRGFSKYVTFSGRARASEYWYWSLFCVIVSFAVGGIAGFGMVASDSSGDMTVNTGLSNLVNVVLFLPSLAVTVRRLHDTNRSGWWLVLPGALSVVTILLFITAFGMGVVGVLSDSPDSGQGLTAGAAGFAIAGGVVGLGTLATWIMLIVWCASDGGPNVPNKYGVRE